MEILDNATIVRNLSDSTLLGNVWSMAEGLIEMVDFMEEIKSIEDKHHNYTLSDEDSYYNYLHLLESFSKQWSESLNVLNLEDLDRWLINDSSDISQLEFRLKQIRCRTGKMWNKDDTHQLHTDLLHITDRLADVIVGLKDNAFMCMYDLEAVETNARQDAVYIRNFVCKWLRDVLAIQDRMQKIIDGAEQILNPQPTETENKKKSNPPVLENDELKPIFEAAMQKGWMERQDYGFKWLRSNPLLAYFVRVLSIYLDLSEKLYDDADSVNWSYFSGLFRTKRQGGKWEYADATKLHDYMYGNMRGKTKFEPKGFNEIEDLMTDFR